MKDANMQICDALRDFVPFVQFKKRGKHPWRSVNFSTKSNTPLWVFFTFFKLHKWYQVAQRITYFTQFFNPFFVPDKNFGNFHLEQISVFS